MDKTESLKPLRALALVRGAADSGMRNLHACAGKTEMVHIGQSSSQPSQLYDFTWHTRQHLLYDSITILFEWHKLFLALVRFLAYSFTIIKLSAAMNSS